MKLLWWESTVPPLCGYKDMYLECTCILHWFRKNEILTLFYSLVNDLSSLVNCLLDRYWCTSTSPLQLPCMPIHCCIRRAKVGPEETSEQDRRGIHWLYLSKHCRSRFWVWIRFLASISIQEYMKEGYVFQAFYFMLLRVLKTKCLAGFINCKCPKLSTKLC